MMRVRVTMLVGVAACQPQWDVGEEVDAGGHDDTGESDGLPELSIGDQPESDKDIFRQDLIHTIEIELADGSEASLWAEPYEYAPGSVTIDGELVADVGVRLRGKIGSFRTLDGKPKLKLDFNRYVDGQRFQELESLSLNNSVVDCSYMKEVMAYEVFAQIGAPASRTAFAEVSIDGRSYGLYVIVETQDDRFIRRNWSESSGNLYDGKYLWYGDRDYILLDFAEGKDELYQLEEGDDVGNADIAAVSNALAAAAGQPDFYESMAAVVDWEQIHRVWAGEQWVGQNDGYCLNKNNYRVYFDPEDGRADWIPWDMDYSFLIDSDWGRDWRRPGGNLAAACFADDTCRSAHLAVVEEVLAVVDQLDLVSLHDELADLTEDAAERDPRRECRRGEIRPWREYTREWVEDRSERVRWDWGL